MLVCSADAIYGGPWEFGTVANARIPSTGNVPAPDLLPKITDLWADIWDQIDLNSSDGVLLYSGILQAIPLVGGALKGVSILNHAARRLSKSFRKQPFTTVVKSLISADFIDRFVVKPTIDDMQKFADASDYVLRVLNTAQTRNSELATAFQAEQSVTVRESTSSYSFSAAGARIQGQLVNKAQVSCKLMLLAKVTYDQNAIDPVKLWAARAGLSRPLDSVWDLVPFSFVIDYFTRAGDFISHVGDAISDQEALIGKVGTVYDCWLCTSRKAEIISKPTARVLNQYHRNFKSNQPTISASAGYFSRAQVPIMNEPGFWEGGGLIKPSLSTTRLRTLAELIIQSKL